MSAGSDGPRWGPVRMLVPPRSLSSWQMGGKRRGNLRHNGVTYVHGQDPEADRQQLRRHHRQADFGDPPHHARDAARDHDGWTEPSDSSGSPAQEANSE